MKKAFTFVLSFLVLLLLVACGLVQEEPTTILGIPAIPTTPNTLETGQKGETPPNVVQSPNPSQGDTIPEAPDAATELKVIQSNVFSMMVDFDLSILPEGDIAGTGNATNDMAMFPGGTYHLYGMNMSGVLVKYSAWAKTQGSYTVDTHGKVTQVSFPPTSTQPTVKLPEDKIEAAAFELAGIKAAVVSMMLDNSLASLPAGDIAGTRNATNDMTIFPSARYHLYAMTINGKSVNYVASRYAKGTYSVDAKGTVTQVATGY